MFVHALSGAASFAACLRLFRSYPLALNPSYPGDPGPTSARHAAGWRGSIVLRHRGFDEPGFYVLSQHPAEHFTLRPWQAGDGECQEIRPGTPVPVVSHRIDHRGHARAARGRAARLGDRPAGDGPAHRAPRQAGRGGRAGRPAAPACLTSACSPWSGSEPIRWPSFTASPLDDGRLWEYVERGELVDLAPVLDRAEGAYWVPSQHPDRARRGSRLRRPRPQRRGP